MIHTVFVSVGATANNNQETFVRAVETRLTNENLNPATVGRNLFGSVAPLRTIMDSLNKSSGIIVIAMERTFFPNGFEKRGGSFETPLNNIAYPTPWNQIEAALAYSKSLPIMIIVENGLKMEGLLEYGYDWYVIKGKLEPALLNTNEFNGVFSDWKKKVEVFQTEATATSGSSVNLTEITLFDLVRAMKIPQVWAVLAAIAILLASAFALGSHFPSVVSK